MRIGEIHFPRYRGTRCLMMPYVQGDPASVPEAYQAHHRILRLSV